MDITASDIIKRLDGVTRHSGYWRSYCPMHGETVGSKPSLLIRETGVYCLSPRCSWHRKRSLEDAENFLDRLGKWQGSSLPSEPFSWPKWNDWTEWCNQAHLAACSREDVKSYLKTRRISVETMRMAHIGWAQGKLVFPCRAKGEVYSFILRDMVPDGFYRVPPKSLNTLYNPFQIESDKFYLTFGIVDALTYNQMGYPAVSTLRNWTNLETLAEQIKETSAYYIIVPDKGEEAQAEKLRSALHGWQSEVFIPNWKRVKDANEYYIRYGRSRFVANLTRA